MTEKLRECLFAKTKRCSDIWNGSELDVNFDRPVVLCSSALKPPLCRSFLDS